MKWEDIAVILSIYEGLIESNEISRYGTGKDIKPNSLKILEGYNKLKEHINYEESTGEDAAED